MVRLDGSGTRVHANGSRSPLQVDFALAPGDTIRWSRFGYSPHDAAVLYVEDADGAPSHLCHLPLSP